MTPPPPPPSANQPAASALAVPHVHLIGVCGMGVGPLAIYLRREGWEVSGWDDAVKPPMSTLLHSAGVSLVPFSASTAPLPALVGFSSAVNSDHPQRKIATALGIPFLRRGELLAKRVCDKHLIAVCGSHGKTTTCGMLAQALLAAGVDAGYILGGLYRDETVPPAHVGSTPWVVAEIDESDGTIGRFSPEITVAVNLDWDHPDYYRSIDDLEAVFSALFRRTRRAIFVPDCSERLRRLAAGASARVVVVPVDAAASFNVINEHIALAVTRYIAGQTGTPPLGRFNGIRRRQDVLFEGGTLRIMADYAHHPTEITALLRHLRGNMAATASLTAVFQPHRHTRTRQYAREFATALVAADKVLLLPVYSAGETPVEGGSTASVFSAANNDPRFALLHDKCGWDALADTALAAAKSRQTASHARDTLVFIGAGDIGERASAFAAQIRWSALAHDFPVGSRTTFGCGGRCAFYAEPDTLDELRALLREASERALPHCLLGKGSNLLVSDSDFNGIVISPRLPDWSSIRLEPPRLICAGGASLRQIAVNAAGAGLEGFAFLEGIPGTLGGALRMNAGARGACIFDRVESVKWLDASGVFHESPRAFFSFGKRDCPELHDSVVLEVSLIASGCGDPDDLRTQMRAFADRRRASQPAGRSAGCAFKNPPDGSAGRIIDSLGLKGVAVGGAIVSPVHANFVVNAGSATATDIATLVRHVRSTVFSKTGISLEPEIILLGEQW
ncbi:MAG: UDP-N-acetylmuramate dehydrogenase [Puniceicoccales bacterium]|jgi:UDP-N-acetylenolpyruvoylglucosamine reductase|nr:UDP-N-acetylmuramate dehydrogenase [Puniceicoccales bacterium]